MIGRYNPVLLPKVRSSEITSAANGSPCTLRIAPIFGLRCLDESTSVLDHFNSYGKGLSTKSSDLCAGFACFNCHRILDQPNSDMIATLKENKTIILERIIASVFETHAMLLEKGIISVKGGVVNV